MDDLTFEYAELPEGVTLSVKKAAERIKLRMQRTVADIIETGRDLMMVRDTLRGDGQFLQWIENDCDMSQAMAYRFMQAAERFGGDLSHVISLSPRAIFELAAPSTPDSVVETVKTKVEKGEKVFADEIKRLRQRASEVDLLRVKNSTLTVENEELNLKIDDLMADREKVPAVITVQPDQATMNTLYDGFVAHWQSLPMELRERFFEEHRTPFAATKGGDIPAFLARS